MKTLYKSLLLGLIIVFNSCGEKENTVTVDNSKPVNVKVATVSPDDNNPFVTASGTVEAVDNANLSTRMMGYVERIYVKVGDKVNKGQLLLAINNSDLQAKKAQVNASITEARAAFANAEKDYNRYTNLFKENSASQKELDDITANYNMAKARLEGAKQMKNEVEAQFAYANIRAPFSGVVTARFVEEGTMANPGMPLLSVESPKQFEVVARVAENSINQLKTDMEVDVVISSINTTVKGKVTEVSSSSANTGGQYLVKVILDEKNDKIKSGMFATVQFPLEKSETQKSNTKILVPQDALVYRGQLTGIYTVSQQNTAVLRWLRTGRTFGNQVEVLSGLSTDESYIVSSEGKLYNGAKLSPSSILPKVKEVTDETNQ
ncbi:MAG: efflux transporter periplasmic adaptor subunit [Flavobacteriaceae bacterium]|nr:efflux transporter periplasmic adaptor subunit [Flavobacteriaceae bacterium]|tara:strand:+ start:443 stop:1573 length:1131 start_codon:yes stop_codon:yes gene_type:complete